MSFNEQISIPFGSNEPEEIKKEEEIEKVADAPVMSEVEEENLNVPKVADAESPGVPKEEMKKTEQVGQVIKLTDKQIAEREDDWKYKKEIGNREHGF